MNVSYATRAMIRGILPPWRQGNILLPELGR